MKSQHTGHALRTLAAAAPPSIAVVCGAERRRQRADRAAPVRERVRHVRDVPGGAPRTGRGGGAAGARQRHPRHRPVPARRRRGAEQIAAAVASATFESVARPDIMRWKYGKLLNNLGNAVDALCGPGPAGRPVQLRAREEGARASPPPASTFVTPEEDAARRGDVFRWGGGADVPPGRVVVAEPGPGHRLDRGRLPQRRDRLPRPPARRRYAREPALQRLADHGRAASGWAAGRHGARTK